ncbi:hypothetical protein M878_44480 [Streptomyces roseochromogenus subsp. oscitans DS 12.976]|uniref:SGNH hydrolase-type esterase domain-containing protein n=2 Tax=Streptomyces roseochromogenus TaxID=285450 RepID=V6JG00_STRRC|nr:hypothetical protein M878_44480 [Streptomyces roseochromogenus subsp. oscitans DS 12.976]
MERNPDLYSGKSRDEIFPDGTYNSKESGKTAEPGCHRSDAAEIHTAGIGHAGRTRNLACSGATTDDILTNEYRGEKPQIQQLDSLLRSADVDTVVVSIGGNDLDLSGLVEDCAKKYFSAGVIGGTCDGANPLAKPDAPEYTSLQEKVGKVLTKVRETFKDRGKTQPRIILQGYPRPIAKKEDLRPIPSVSSRYQNLGYPFKDESVDLLQQVSKHLNNALRKAASLASVNYLDTTEAFQGHELGHKNSVLQVKDGETSDGRAKGKYGPESLEWTRWVDNLGVIGDEQRKRESLHPNYLGTQSEAACLTSFIKQMTKTGAHYTGTCHIGKADGAKQAGPDQTVAAVTEETPRTGIHR